MKLEPTTPETDSAFIICLIVILISILGVMYQLKKAVDRSEAERKIKHENFYQPIK